jgi:ferrous iron transport protein A
MIIALENTAALVLPLTAAALSQSIRDMPLADSSIVALGEQRRGFSGVVAGLRFEATPRAGSVSNAELERRLLEMGFVEGASVEILHEGLIGRDPIAVRLDDMRVAMRRREARCVLIRPGVRR